MGDIRRLIRIPQCNSSRRTIPWFGYLQDYPDYWIQGETLADLAEHLKDLYLDVSGGHIPGARKVGELVTP